MSSLLCGSRSKAAQNQVEECCDNWTAHTVLVQAYAYVLHTAISSCLVSIGKGPPGTSWFICLPFLCVDMWTLSQHQQQLTLLLPAGDFQTPPRQLQPNLDLNSCTSQTSSQSHLAQDIDQDVYAAQSLSYVSTYLPTRHHRQVLDVSNSEEVRLCTYRVHLLRQQISHHLGLNACPHGICRCLHESLQFCPNFAHQVLHVKAPSCQLVYDRH